MAPRNKRSARPEQQRRGRKRYRKQGSHVDPPAGDIPNEILSQILSRCDDETLRIAMQTCRRWHAVINETIGITLAVGKASVTTINRPKLPFRQIEAIESVGVKHCYVGELNDVHGCPFRYPQTVRSLVFDGAITNFNLVTMLAPLPSLTHLTFHYAALEDAKIKSDTLRSVALKSLRITSHLINQYYDRSKAIAVTENTITLLLSIHSQQLKFLVLDLIHIPPYEKNLTKAVLTVLVRHKRTLHTVQCYNTMKVQEPDPPGTETEASDDPQELSLMKEEIVIRAIREAVNIKRICYAGLQHVESDLIWNQLITAQKCLQELFYMNDNRNIRATGIACLKTNSTTLCKLLFHINAVDETRTTNVFDCGLFKSFQNLSHLLIRGRQLIFRNIIDAEANISRVTLKVPVLRNVELIPDTVTVLSLRDIYVDSLSLSRFQKLLPSKLAKFRLVDGGSFGDYGILPETLVDLLQHINLKEIEIVRSFSKNSWDSATGKDIYEDALFYRIKSTWEFHASRSSSGILHFKSGQMFNYGQSENTLRANDVCEVVFQ